MLDWPSYAINLRECFGSRKYRNTVFELVSLKQQDSVEDYHDIFVSIMNQISDLPEPHVLAIFLSNLKLEERNYLQLFKPQTLVEAFNLACEVEDILDLPLRKGFLSRSNVVPRLESLQLNRRPVLLGQYLYLQ